MEVWRTVVFTTALLVAGGVAACATPAPGPAPVGDPTVTPGGPTSAPGGEGGTSLEILLDEAGTGEQVRWSLECDPETGEVLGGDHPTATEACALLADPASIDAFTPTPAGTMCTEQWGGPQVAVVRGTVDGRDLGEVRFDRTNGCEISRWDALAVLLGSAGGVTM